MRQLRKWRSDAVAAAASLKGRRFGLLVASSLVATSAIVASALTGTGGSGALAAALLGRSPTSQAVAPEAIPRASGPGGGSSGPAPSSPLPAPEPAASPVESSQASPPVPAPPPSPQPAPESPAQPTPEAGRVKHVFVISLASAGYEAAFGSAPQMPYLSGTLRPQGELLSSYSLLDQAALPNQIAAIGGQPPNQKTAQDCPLYSEFPAGAAIDKRGVVEGTGCLYPVEALTLADQLSTAQLEWRGYMEGMADEAGKPANCVHPEVDAGYESPPGGYAPQGNPFIYFHSLLDLGDCAAKDVPLTELSGDLAKPDSTPSYSLISPDLCDAGIPGQCPAGAADGPAAADAFLAAWVPEILASPAYEKDGLLIVTFAQLDPDDTAASAPASAEEPKVGALLLSPFAPPGGTDAAPYDPYSLLRSVEDLFGLQHLGLAAGAKVKSFAPPLLGETGGGD